MIRDLELYCRKMLSSLPENEAQVSYQAAVLWYQSRTGKSFPKRSHLRNFGKLPPAPKTLVNLFTSYPAVSEGELDGITPEVISFLDEHHYHAKKMQGIFYTPYPLAEQLAKNLLCLWLQNNQYSPTRLPKVNSAQALKLEKKLADLKICDPACGSGGLLVPLWLEIAKLRCMLNSNQSRGDALLSILQKNIYITQIKLQNN